MTMSKALTASFIPAGQIRGCREDKWLIHFEEGEGDRRVSKIFGAVAVKEGTGALHDALYDISKKTGLCVERSAPIPLIDTNIILAVRKRTYATTLGLLSNAVPRARCRWNSFLFLADRRR
jgi:hypothetical protein